MKKTKKTLINFEHYAVEMMDAAKKNDVKQLEFFLVDKKQNIHLENDELLMAACCEGALDVVKFVLTSPKLTEHIELNKRNHNALLCAAYDGHLDILKYLLSSSDLKNKVSIRAREDQAFIYACHNGHLEMIEYMCLSPELKEHSDPYAQDSEAFKYFYKVDDLIAMRYIVERLKINPHEDFIDWLNTQKNKNSVFAFINSYQLKESMEVNLSKKEDNKKKAKV